MPGRSVHICCAPMSRRAASCGLCQCAVAIMWISLRSPQEPPFPRSFGHRVSRGGCGSRKRIAFPVKSGHRALSPLVLCLRCLGSNIEGVLDERHDGLGYQISHPQAVRFVPEWCQGNLQMVRSSRLGVSFVIDTLTRDLTQIRRVVLQSSSRAPGAAVPVTSASFQSGLNLTDGREKSLVISTGPPFLLAVDLPVRISYNGC